MNTLPLFYSQPVPFDTAVHGALQFAEAAPDFGFASGVNVIPLLVSEVAQAVRHYPLVFLPSTQDVAPTLVALVDLGDNVNRFVNSQGQWRADTYIPAYVRRYPFLPLRVPDKPDPILGIDIGASWINAKGGEVLVDATGHATPRLERVMAFQLEYQQQAEMTVVMCAALQGSAVLEPRTLSWKSAQGEPRQVDGFLCVQETKLKALTPGALTALHQADALGLAYAQLLSMSNLQGLVAAATQFTVAPQPGQPAKKGKLRQKKPVL
jgi:hypothetical protein